INERRVADRAFQLYVCNTAGDKTRIRDQAKWMSDQVHVPAIFTSGSSQTLSVANDTVPLGILVMTATATSPEITSVVDNGLIWRTAPSDAIQGKVIANQIPIL